MKKYLKFLGAVLIMCSFLIGCSKHVLYTDEEMTEIHDIISYVEQMEVEYEHVIMDSLTTKLGEKMSTDMEFVDYISTRGYDPDKPMVALTFDDGPKSSTTSAILDILEEYGVKATFFVIGSNLGDNTADLLERMVSLGCEIGNHSYNHTQLTTLDEEGIHEEIDTVNDLIKELSGRECRLIRPPYGSINDTLSETVSQPLILWSVDTLDWSSRNASSVISKVKSNVSDGSIILMHDIYSSTAEACETIIPWLIEEGYQLVTVSELAYMRGIELEAGSKYTNIRPAE